MSASEQISPYLAGLEVLGVSTEDDLGTAYEGATWIRFYIEFVNLRGEDVIDTPAFADLPEGQKATFFNRSFHVSKLDEDEIRSAVTERLSQIRSCEKASIFAELDEIGFSETEVQEP